MMEDQRETEKQNAITDFYSNKRRPSHISKDRSMKDFEMTQDQLDALLNACAPVPMIALQCGTPRSQQENANNAWRALGEVMGFDSETVRPNGKGDRFFTAEEANSPEPQAQQASKGTVLSVSNEQPGIFDAVGYEALDFNEVTNQDAEMKTPTLTQIRQHVESTGGTYKKLKMYLNGNDAYEVNNMTMTKADMIERFQRGEL